MINVTVHISNEGFGDFMDEKLKKELELQCLPHKGDMFWLSEDTIQEFYDIVYKENLYAEYQKWMQDKYEHLSFPELKITDKNILQKDLSFDDACIVNEVLFYENGEIHIELSNHV